MKKIAIIIAISLVLGISTIMRLFPSYTSVLEANWGINLPVKAVLTEEYSKESHSSFHGDGIRYHVFSYKYEDYIDLMFAWSSSNKETLYYSSLNEAASAWLDEIDVPLNERPKCYQCFTWYRSQVDHSEIIIFWDDGLNKVYIIESFM